MRRFFRIFPLYYFFLLILFLAAIFAPSIRSQMGLNWNLFYVSNFRMVFLGWPWRPISHLWSLSVEEQFYLLWPAMIFVMPSRRTLETIAIIFCAFVALRQVGAVLGLNGTAIYGVLHLDG